MKIISKFFKVLPFFIVVFALTSCSDDDDNNNPVQLLNVVDTIIADADFSTLVTALTAANLVDTVRNSNDITVLAPTNAAFSAFLNDNGFASLDDVPSDVLTNVLLNHVIGSQIPSSTITSAGSGYTNTNATNADGDNLSLYYEFDETASPAGVYFNGSSLVEQADILGTNGIIHKVNAVIGLPTVVTFATADPTFSTLVTALTTETPATDFAAILSRTATGNTDMIDPDFTVFAPTNTAFQDLLDSNNAWNSLADIDDTLLTNVLLHHVLGGANVRSGDLTPNGNTTATTLLGQDITITLPGTNSNIADVTDGAGNNDIGIVVVDVQANNGVIHVINKVLLPM